MRGHLPPRQQNASIYDVNATLTWAYALRHANDIMNNTPNMQNKKKRTAMQIFSNSNININKKHWQPFGCPVYVLDNALANGKPFHKWKQRTRIGVYLGMSPSHGRNVALVLSRETGHVSPQFHVTFETGFQTVKQLNLDSKWQQKTYFTNEKEDFAQPERKRKSDGEVGNKNKRTRTCLLYTSPSPRDRG